MLLASWPWEWVAHRLKSSPACDGAYYDIHQIIFRRSLGLRVAIAHAPPTLRAGRLALMNGDRRCIWRARVPVFSAK